MLFLGLVMRVGVVLLMEVVGCMSCPGEWDRGGKFEGDRVVCVDADQYGRKGTVLGDPGGFGAVLIVKWDGDDVARSVSALSVRIDTCEED